MKARKPNSTGDWGLSVAIFGPDGSGKTTAACMFPHSLFIDVEGGARNQSYQALLEQGGSVIFESSSWDEIYAEVASAMRQGEVPIQTIVLDSATVLFEALGSEGEKARGIDWRKDLVYAERRYGELMRMVTKSGFNLVVVFRGKEAKLQPNNPKSPIILIPDGPKDPRYDFEVRVRLEKAHGGVVAHVEKSRKVGLAEGDTFPWSYEEFAKRLPKEAFEQAIVPKVPVTNEQLYRIGQLCAALSVTQEQLAKLCSKYAIAGLEELTAEQADKVIGGLSRKLEAVSPARSAQVAGVAELPPPPTHEGNDEGEDEEEPTPPEVVQELKPEEVAVQEILNLIGKQWPGLAQAEIAEMFGRIAGLFKKSSQQFMSSLEDTSRTINNWAACVAKLEEVQ